MKNVMILSAGVTTGWHLAKVAKQYFPQNICLHLCDTNPQELVAAAVLADHFHQVPYLVDADYKRAICELLREWNIDVIVPLIDQDLFTWAADAPELLALGVRSTAPVRSTVQRLSDKKEMASFLQKNNLPTPRLVKPEEMIPGRLYIEKSEVGCGSQGMKVLTGGKKFEKRPTDILQEKCDGDGREITAEIFNAQGMLRVFCRERVLTKAGVCTKMTPVHIPEIENYIAKLVQLVPCPAAFCAQFMEHRGRWNLIDCNLRLGAGTAMSSAAGFQLTRAFWANICGQPVQEEWLKPDSSVKAVLRVYDEVVVR